jgi:CRISPR-associated protein Csb1
MTTTHPELTLATLQQAVAGGAAAVRCVTRLQPAGGKADKIFPPTYATGDKATTRYAFEDRRIDGQPVRTVLLDSVASQANRIEESLQAAWEEERLSFPVITVNFTRETEIADLDTISVLQAPHRIADALLRDSLDAKDKKTRFRETKIGRAYTEATVKNATAVYVYCPTALIFGVWDSTGPKGGMGSKFQRALVSEIVGIGAEPGVKTASRLDPAGIQANVPIFHGKDDSEDWTTKAESAAKDKAGKPVSFSRKSTEGKNKGKASAVNHSNVAPTIEDKAGGVTIDYALQTTVLSLPALRRLRFPADGAGKSLGGRERIEAETAARTALAALAIAGITEQRTRGYDLRSRSFLIPEDGQPLSFELVPTDGGEGERYSVDVEAASRLVAAAAAAAAQAGFTWERVPLELVPAPKLSDLIRESRKRAAEGEADEASE